MFQLDSMTGGRRHTKRRGSRKAAKRSGRRKSSRKSSRRKGSRKSSRKSTKKRSGKKRKMNQFFTMMMAAKKKGSPSFSYKGKTYHRKEKNGMTYYKA